MQNPTLEDFLRRARHEFHFLVVEFGFQEQTLPKSRSGNPYEVRYRSGSTLVIVEGINWGYGVNVLLGPTRQPIFRSEDTFPLWPIVKLRRPDLNNGLAIGDQLVQLSSWATALRESAEDVLRGDFSIRAEAEKITKDVASSVALEERAKLAEWQYRTDIEKAQEAFRAKDYATVVALLMKHEARLTPSERVKLEYTRKKCS
jgi:hypothetical protein